MPLQITQTELKEALAVRRKVHRRIALAVGLGLMSMMLVGFGVGRAPSIEGWLSSDGSLLPLTLVVFGVGLFFVITAWTTYLRAQTNPSYQSLMQAVLDRDAKLQEITPQKAVLIKELHHRVKNNLQTIVSLLSLHSKQMSEPAAKVAIDDVRKRVNGFALVHRLIFELDNDGTVDLNLVLDAVVLELRRNFTGDHRTVVMRVDVPSIKIDEDLAVAISLFAIEAVTGAMTSDVPLSCNSIAITVTVTRPASDRLRLSIADDGPERQINLPQHQQTIGERLMNAFALQIARELPKYRREAGRTYLELDFQEKSRQLQSA